MQSNFFTLFFYSTPNTCHELFIYSDNPLNYIDFYRECKSTIDGLVFEVQQKQMDANVAKSDEVILVDDKEIYKKLIETLQSKGFKVVTPIKTLYKSQNLLLLN